MNQTTADSAERKSEVAGKAAAVVGTCQCCFNQQVSKGAGGLVLHGYERPGHGSIRGNCPGMRHLPFELSCAQTKIFAASVASQLAGMRATLARMQANEIESYSVEVTDYTQWVGRRHPTHLVSIPKGFDDNVKGYGHVRFEDIRQSRIREQEADIRSTARLLADLQARITGWKYAPEALKTHETVAREREEVAAAARAARAAERDEKARAKAERPLPKRVFGVLQALAAEGSRVLGRGTQFGYRDSIDLDTLRRRGFARYEVSGGLPYEDTHRETYTINDAGRAALARQGKKS